MFEITQSTHTPVSKETGIFNSNWKRILFVFHKRAFESKLEGILRSAEAHEANSLPRGAYEYQQLNAHAELISTEFANRWGVDVDLLKARIPGLAKLAGMSIPPPTRNYGRFLGLGMLAMPVAVLLLGIMAGLISVGFHLVGGR